MFGNPGSCVDDHVPLKSDPEGDDGAGEDGDDEPDEFAPDPLVAAPPASSEGDVGSSDVDLFVNWQPLAAIAQSTTRAKDPCLIPSLHTCKRTHNLVRAQG